MKLKGPAFPSFSDPQTPAPRRQWVAHTGARARARNLRHLAQQKDQTMSKGLEAATGVPLVGQPFTFANATVPVTGQLTCNCRLPGTAMAVVASAPVTCPHCQKTFVAVLPVPPSSQVLVFQVTADGPQVPS